MTSKNTKLLLITIPFSHYVEKSRWALEYYGVPYDELRLMPALHGSVVRTYIRHLTPEQKNARAPGQSRTEIPILVVRGADGSSVETVIQGSQLICEYLTARHASETAPSLYETCGAERAARVKELEDGYDDALGPATRAYMYSDLFLSNRLGSLVPWALLGFRDGVGLWHGLKWFFWSPLVAGIIVRVFGLDLERKQREKEVCRRVFEEASKLLEDSPFLAGESFSEADIAFASLAYPVLGVSNDDGFTCPTLKNVATKEAMELRAELRATKAGEHALKKDAS